MRHQGGLDSSQRTCSERPRAIESRQSPPHDLCDPSAFPCGRSVHSYRTAAERKDFAVYLAAGRMPISGAYPHADDSGGITWRNRRERLDHAGCPLASACSTTNQSSWLSAQKAESVERSAASRAPPCRPSRLEASASADGYTPPMAAPSRHWSVLARGGEIEYDRILFFQRCRFRYRRPAVSAVLSSDPQPRTQASPAR